MCHWARAMLSFIFVTASANCASNQFVARYVPIGTSGSAKLMAADASGNFFVVATVTEPSGITQIRATKTNSQGIIIATFDLAGPTHLQMCHLEQRWISSGTWSS